MLNRSTHRTLDPTHSDRRGHLWRSRWAAIGAAVAVTLGAGGLVGLASAASSPPSDIVSITPVRVLDTRDPNNVGLAGPFVSQVAQDLKVTGPVQTSTGLQLVVPGGATSVVLNVTTVGATADGFVSVRPADAPGAPTTSNLNFRAGEINPNTVIVQLPTTGPDAGEIEITYDAFGTAGPTTDVLVDVMGYTVEAPAGSPRTLFAVVEQDGTLVRATPPFPASSQLLPALPTVGRYVVTFDTNISACAYNATVGRPGVNDGPPIGFAMVANWANSPNDSVIVFVKDQNGNGAQRAFHLTVVC
jgi:hypothetical protein